MRRRVLVTGHTGFKGAWLCLWLQRLGAEVSGLARGRPGGRSLYELAAVGEHMRELQGDVCDAATVCDRVEQARPEIVLHLAAQPLVGRALSDPALTFEVNVMGTVNVLEAVRQAGSEVRAVVVVGSDRCYEPHRGEGGQPQRLAEDERLGGAADPYASSKASLELVVSAYRRSFFSETHAPRIATARAGNVIGGGDWARDRLVADAVRAVEESRTLEVRNPLALRPWQHVLNPLEGYLLLAEALCRDASAARAWNFGPAPDDARPVSWIVERLGELWGGALSWRADEGETASGSTPVALDCAAAEQELEWRPRLRLQEALGLVVDWHRAERAGADMRAVSLEQIALLPQ
jgi:CDP-glucose 4,6-dehydratase